MRPGAPCELFVLSKHARSKVVRCIISPDNQVNPQAFDEIATTVLEYLALEVSTKWSASESPGFSHRVM